MNGNNKLRYIAIAASQIPPGIRWDVPGHCQGQIVERAYASPGARGEEGPGALYKRVIDRSEPGVVRLYRLEGGAH